MTAARAAQREGFGGAPMTGAQALQLKALAQLTREPEAFAEHLSSATAIERIGILRAKLRKDLGGAQHKP